MEMAADSPATTGLPPTRELFPPFSMKGAARLQPPTEPQLTALREAEALLPMLGIVFVDVASGSGRPSLSSRSWC